MNGLGEALSYWSKIPCGSPTIGEILVDNNQDFVPSTHSDFFQGQKDRGLFYWINHWGELSCQNNTKKKN
jgi:hypothetical protein